MCGTCGTDLKIMSHPFPSQPPFGEFTPGHEWTGTVVALGDTVDEFAVGDRVAIEAHSGCGRCENCVLGMYTACLNYGNLHKGHRTSGFTADGGFAEYAVHHAKALYKMPPNVSWEDAVLVSTAGTGLYGIDAAGGFIVGQSVVVLGPGPVGLMTVQLAKALGAAQVILVGTRASRLEFGTRLGADAVVSSRDEDPVAAVRRLTGGLGADLVIEASGALDTPQQTRRDGEGRRQDPLPRVLQGAGDLRPEPRDPLGRDALHHPRRRRRERRARPLARRAGQDSRRGARDAPRSRSTTSWRASASCASGRAIRSSSSSSRRGSPTT